MRQQDAFNINAPLFDIPGLPEDTNRRAAEIIKGDESSNKAREGFRVAPYYGSQKEKERDLMTTGYGQTFKGNNVPDYAGEGLPTVEKRLIPLDESIRKNLSNTPVTESFRTQLKLFGDNAGQGRMENAIAIFKSRGLDAANEYMHNSIGNSPDVAKGLTARRDYEESIGRQPYNPLTNPIEAGSNQVPMLSEPQRFREDNLSHQTPMGAMSRRDFNRGLVSDMGNNPQLDTDANGNIINPNIRDSYQQTSPHTPQTENRLPIEKIQQAHKETSELQKETLGSNPLNEFMKKDPSFIDALKRFEEATNNASNLLSQGMMDKAKIESGAADEAYNQLKNYGDMAKKNYDDFMKKMESLDDHVNKNRLVENMPIANKLLMAVSLFAGAFTRDRQNSALNMIQSEIQKDMDIQKTEYERGKAKAENIYKIASNYSSNEWERNKLAEQIMYQMAASRLDMAKAQALPEQTKAAIEQMKASFMNIGSKDSLEVLQKRLNISKTMQDMDLANAKHGMEVGKSVILDPVTGKQLGNVPDVTEAREIRSLTAKTAIALKSIKDLRDQIQKASRMGNWLNPVSKNDMSMKLSSVMTTLDLANQASPNARLPLAEVKNLGKMFDDVIKGRNIAKYGPEFFVGKMDELLNHTKYAYKMRMYSSGLESPDFVNEVEGLPQER